MPQAQQTKVCWTLLTFSATLSSRYSKEANRPQPTIMPLGQALYQHSIKIVAGPKRLSQIHARLKSYNSFRQKRHIYASGFNIFRQEGHSLRPRFRSLLSNETFCANNPMPMVNTTSINGARQSNISKGPNIINRLTRLPQTKLFVEQARSFQQFPRPIA